MINSIQAKPKIVAAIDIPLHLFLEIPVSYLRKYIKIGGAAPDRNGIVIVAEDK